MPAVKLSPIFNSQLVDANGVPAVGHKIFTYVAGSSTPTPTYTDNTGSVAQSNPIILNTLGFPTMGQIWIPVGQVVKLVYTDPTGVVLKTEDYVSGINDTSTAVDEWTDTGLAPTYISGSSFTLQGDQTSAFHVGRRMKFQVTAGTVYGRITASVFTTLTTVTMQMDGAQVLDAGLTSAQLSILRNNVLSVPARIATATGTDTYAASVGIARLVIGDEYEINIPNRNLTNAATLNLDTTGPLAIVNQAGVPTQRGSLVGQHKFRYNGTNFTVLNPFGSIQPTAVFTLSGTSTDIMGIQTGAKRISLLPFKVGSSGTSLLQIQYGTASGIESTGYFSSAITNGASAGSTTGALLHYRGDAANSVSGGMDILLQNPSLNIWTHKGSVYGAPSDGSSLGGDKTLSGSIDRIRITTVSGVPTIFGSVSLFVEY